MVSIDTEGEFTSQVKQGPKILGKIEYATSTPSDVNDYDSWREYGGLFSSKTLSTLQRYRESNTLEKYLTPVVSFNDEAYVISYTNVKNALGVSDEDDFLNSMQALETEGMVMPVFNRLKDSDGNETNKYQLMGYNFKAPFLIDLKPRLVKMVALMG